MRAHGHTRIICVHARRILHEVGRLVRNRTVSAAHRLRVNWLPSARTLHPMLNGMVCIPSLVGYRVEGVAPTGSLTLPSGPFFFFLRPTRGGGGASYFFSFFSLSWRHDVPYATYAFAPG